MLLHIIIIKGAIRIKTVAAILVFLLYFPFSAKTQTKQIDSLYHLAQSAPGSKQVDLYVTLASLTRNSNADTAIFFAKKA